MITAVPLMGLLGLAVFHVRFELANVLQNLRIRLSDYFQRAVRRPVVGGESP
jgi:hypothetical protein